MKTHNGVRYELHDAPDLWRVFWPSGLKGFFRGSEEDLKEMLDNMRSA